MSYPTHLLNAENFPQWGACVNEQLLTFSWKFKESISERSFYIYQKSVLVVDWDFELHKIDAFFSFCWGFIIFNNTSNHSQVRNSLWSSSGSEQKACKTREYCKCNRRLMDQSTFAVKDDQGEDPDVITWLKGQMCYMFIERLKHSTSFSCTAWRGNICISLTYFNLSAMCSIFNKSRVNISLCQRKKRDHSSQESWWKSFHRKKRERERGGMEEGGEKTSLTTTMQQMSSVQWTCPRVPGLGRQRAKRGNMKWYLSAFILIRAEDVEA